HRLSGHEEATKRASTLGGHSMRHASLTITAVAIAIGASAACSGAQTGKSSLILERSYTLPHVSGRIDHLAYDTKSHRLFIAELGNNSVDALDLDSGRTSRIERLKEPQGLGYLAKQDELVVALGGDGSVRFFS